MISSKVIPLSSTFSKKLMKLRKLFPDAPDLTIHHLMTDSRLYRNDAVFYCLKGMVHDGHQFIEQAIDHGAVVIVHSDSLETYQPNITYIKVQDVLDELNRTAAIFFNHPSRKLKLFGVTGTNGKSTIAKTLKSILHNQISTGYSGTISIEYGSVVEKPEYTTPETIPLLELLNRMHKSKVAAVALEVSSQALDQGRVDALRFDVAIFTNLTHDHLDYHGSFENYYLAKKHLFDLIKDSGTAVINIDDPYGLRLFQEHPGKKVSYSIQKKADYYATDIVLSAQQTDFILHTRQGTYPLSTNVVSDFNLSNLLAVMAALNESLMPIEHIIPHLQNLPQVDGRMQIVNEWQKFNVIVDYAHTPDGFEKIFQFAQSITPPHKKIISVFGAAGKRDTKKRPVLGEISDRYCKNIILTEEDPRTENALDIAKAIASGIKDNNYAIILDRYAAIRQAIELANEQDTVLILAKGNEQYISKELGKEFWPGDEAVAREVLRTLYPLEEESYHD
jgi:UDP-N-acetylmuramoyl-L-alanyl-D-glutamate--2,6-diaminopimelate ligase